LFTDLDYLFLGEAVFAELAHEFLNLLNFAEIKVGESTENVIYLLLRHLMIEIEEELNFLNLLLNVLFADKLRALE
jgi:hypothetical protein